MLLSRNSISRCSNLYIQASVTIHTGSCDYIPRNTTFNVKLSTICIFLTIFILKKSIIYIILKFKKVSSKLITCSHILDWNLYMAAMSDLLYELYQYNYHIILQQHIKYKIYDHLLSWWQQIFATIALLSVSVLFNLRKRKQSQCKNI